MKITAHEDKDHYDRMISLVAPPQVANNNKIQNAVNA
jgi:hypothetical protein